MANHNEGDKGKAPQQRPAKPDGSADQGRQQQQHAKPGKQPPQPERGEGQGQRGPQRKV